MREIVCFLFLRGNLYWLTKVIEITLQHGCYPVSLQHIFRTPLSKNTSGWLFLCLSSWVFFPSTTTVWSLERFNNIQQKLFLEYSVCTCLGISWNHSLHSLFHILLLSTKFLLVSFTFPILKPDTIGLCWVIHSSMVTLHCLLKFSFDLSVSNNIYLSFWWTRFICD